QPSVSLGAGQAAVRESSPRWRCSGSPPCGRTIPKRRDRALPEPPGAVSQSLKAVLPGACSMTYRWAVALLLVAAPPRAEAPRGLEIPWVDVEGGGATLIVTPAGEAVLIDCGSPTPRDAERIHRACLAAGLKQIDHFAVTHWHVDHYGSLDRLSKM